MINEWEKHTLLADTALQLDDPIRSILHYQQALALSDEIANSVEIEAEFRLSLVTIWRNSGVGPVTPSMNSSTCSSLQKKC